MIAGHQISWIFEKGQKRSRHGEMRFCSVNGMLSTLAILGDRSTAGRLRRGLSPAEGPRAVNVMAREACFSRRQFHRLTMRVMGGTPGAHQRRLRLDRGAWLLLTSHATILDVALETGWESHETFTRAFRTRFRVTPSAFRKGGGVSMSRSMRAAFSIALNAVTRSRSSGQAPLRGRPPSGDCGVAGQVQE